MPLDRAISPYLVDVLGCKRLEQREESRGVQLTAPLHAARWPGAIGAIQCSFVLPISRSYQKFARFSSCPTFLLTTFRSSRRRHTQLMISLLNPSLPPLPGGQQPTSPRVMISNGSLVGSIYSTSKTRTLKGSFGSLWKKCHSPLVGTLK